MRPWLGICWMSLGVETVLECVALVCMMLQQHVPEGSGKNSPCWVKGLCHGNDMCKALWGHFAKGSFLHRESVDEEELLRLQLTAEQQRSTDSLSVMCQPGRWTMSSKTCCLCLTEREREGTLLQHQGQILSTEPSDTTNVTCDITVSEEGVRAPNDVWNLDDTLWQWYLYAQCGLVFQYGDQCYGPFVVVCFLCTSKRVMSEKMNTLDATWLPHAQCFV